MTIFLGPGAKGNSAPAQLALRCPGCRHEVSLLALAGAQSGGAYNDVANLSPPHGKVLLGVRKCPNCGAVLFVAHSENKVIESYPPETINFDPLGLPTAVLDCLEEAIRCEAARCFRASAMMIRRTLEEVCKERNASGGDLKKRLAALGKQVAIPAAVIDGLTELRFLGNDAAHVEIQQFPQVDKEEVDLALEVVKIVLQAVYQYEGVVQRLAARRAANSAETNPVG